MGFQIFSISLNNKTFNLSYAQQNNENIYTLVTGKNGLGKTRLLNFIIFQHIKDSYKSYNYSRKSTINLNDFKNIKNVDYKSSSEPTKIIVHTNSKFDNFPRDHEANTRKYINIANSYRYSEMDSIFYKLLLKKNVNYKSVKDTLSYLNYDSQIRFELDLVNTSTPGGYLELTIEKYRESLSLIDFDLTTKPKNLSRNRKKFINLLYYILERKIELPTLNELKVIYNLYLRKDNLFDFYISILIDLNEDKIEYGLFSKNEFNILSKYNLIRINTIYLKKINTASEFFHTSEEYVSFYSLSSGQKSIINTLLGISSVIENNSLICIDEPEISLHPEWQEEIIQKLQEVFIEKTGCHFVIATHSPQVVAGLKSRNGYILDLENGELHNSQEYSKKSADYQLAKIFNSPGYNNEYILKLCFYLLSIIKEGKEPTSDDVKLLKDLINFKSHLKSDDPSLYLINQVQSLMD